MQRSLSVISVKKLLFSPRGFTLVEMIVVVAIIGIFAAGIVAVINPRQQILKAHDTRRKSDLNAIQRGLEAYYQDYGRYPQGLSYKIAPAGSVKEWGSAWSPYMTTIPKDASNSQAYVYYVSADGQGYVVYASLERGGSDPQTCNQGAACTSMGARSIITTAFGGLCNYGVASADINP